VDHLITISMCGDVMTGRGIDQVLPHPSDPVLYEPFVKDARTYVELAEKAHGTILRPVAYDYVWGDALRLWADADARIVNFETSITRSNEFWQGKEIHYRMNPENISCLVAGRIDCCALANNHVMDWGVAGLQETLHSLRDARIKTAGAGRNRSEATAPAILEVAGKGRVLLFSFGSETSGIPRSWAASEERPGVNLLEDFSEMDVQRIRQSVATVKHDHDVVVASIHWGSNWGYDIPFTHQEFAHRLIDEAGIDVIHGHSAHHVKASEVHHGRLILYGCGDFLDDYEGISGYADYRDDLGLIYFANIEPSSGRLVGLRMIPTQIRRMQVHLAQTSDMLWLRDVLNRESREFGIEVELVNDELWLRDVASGRTNSDWISQVSP
jgi:poly-gamma-glutamate synthesis protein (capsule biosynthesis protein)